MAWFFLPLRQARVFRTTVYSVIRYGPSASGIWHIFSKNIMRAVLVAEDLFSQLPRKSFFSETRLAPVLFVTQIAPCSTCVGLTDGIEFYRCFTDGLGGTSYGGSARSPLIPSRAHAR